jgi:hypothetical protein
MFLSRFFSPPILIAAGASFVIGLTATIVVLVWLRPIWRYRRAKGRIAAALEQLSSGGPDAAGALSSVRRDAAALTDCAGDLPSWYRIRLASRKEDPAGAAAHMSTLANTTNRGHQRRRVASVRQALRLD